MPFSLPSVMPSPFHTNNSPTGQELQVLLALRSIYFKGRVCVEEKEIFFQIAECLVLGQGKARRSTQVCHVGTGVQHPGRICCFPRYIGGEQLGQEPMPIWDAGVAGGGFIMPAPSPTL